MCARSVSLYEVICASYFKLARLVMLINIADTYADLGDHSLILYTITIMSKA